MATITFVAKKLTIVSEKDPKEVMQQMKSDLNNCLAVANAQMLACMLFIRAYNMSY